MTIGNTPPSVLTTRRSNALSGFGWLGRSVSRQPLRCRSICRFPTSDSRPLGAPVSTRKPSRVGRRLSAGGAALVGSLAQGKQDDSIPFRTPASVYMMESVPPVPPGAPCGRWVAEESWPVRVLKSPGSRSIPVASNESPAPRLLSRFPRRSRPDSHPALGELRVPGDLPGDQTLDSFGSLQFDSEPLEGRLEILGHASVSLQIASDRPVAVVTARLIDVATDGRATLVARGFST